ncbi:unnamed protein product [Ceratitis capitata]|nr:unnamed protein product [Ceratitis capitata]
MHCPVKHNILSQTLAAGSIETSATKRIKLQASTESLPEKEPATEICNGVVVDEPEKKVTAQALVTADTNLQPNAIVKQEYVAQESSTSNNTNILIKKRKLKNRRVLGPKMTADSCAVQIKQEICSAKIKTEYSAGSDGSDVEPKKLLSTCTYCGKSFERRAALSTHLQHCPVKYSVLEKSTIYGMTTSTKRLKLHSTAEKSPKDTRQENGASSIAEDPDTELLNEMFANLGRQDFGVGLQTVTIEQDDSTVSGTDEAKEEDFAQMDNFQLSTPTEEFAENLPANESSTNVELSTSASAIESSPDANEEDTDKKATRRVRLAPVEKRLLCRCKICYKQFNALSNLRRHISMFHYRAQRFGCTLCEYRAFRRYDIVNHLGNTHGMQGDPEAMSIEFVSEHEVNYSREDVEGDIVVLDESKTNLSTLNELNEDIENNIETRQNLKRLKRNKSTTPVSSELAATMGKVTRTKIKRSQSQQETCVAGSSGGVKTPARRPIRNRIKPENKDFVYDLSSLLKNESATDAPDDTTTRNLRRRNNMQGTATEIATQCLEPLLGPVSTWAAIRGAAQRLAAAIVSSGGATSATQPELPAERPQMRQRLISAQRADNHSVAVIEASDLEAARLQSTLLEDTFLEKVTKASPTNFKIKPSLTLHTSTLNWLLEKVDSSLHQHANGKAPSPNASLKCSDENDINKLQVSPPPSIPRTNAPPPTPRKRLSMLDRLRDDTFKYRDSLLRSALEN